MSGTTGISDFIQANGADGNLSAQQAAQLLELAMGDTGIVPDSSAAPAAAPASTQEPPAAASEPPAAASQQPAGAEPDPANAVIVAKDGVHTIPYERLNEARQQAQQYKGLAESQAAQIEAMQQELQAARDAAAQRVAEGAAPTVADQNLAIAEQAMDAGISPDLFGDFSEEAMAQGVNKLVDMRVSAAVQKAIAPLLEQQQEKQRMEALDAHDRAIYAAHPDADAIGESRELGEWLAAKPSYERAACEHVIKQGDAQKVIELLDAFKRDTGRNQAPAAAAKVDAKAAALAAVAGAKAAAPASLSEIPGGTAAPTNRFEAAAQLPPDQLSAAMQDWSPDQIEAFLNRNG